MDAQTKRLLTDFEEEAVWKHEAHDVSARLSWTVNNRLGYLAEAALTAVQTWQVLTDS